MNQFSPIFINSFNFISILLFFLYCLIKKIIPSLKKNFEESFALEKKTSLLKNQIEQEYHEALQKDQIQKNLITDLKHKLHIWNEQRCVQQKQQQEAIDLYKKNLLHKIYITHEIIKNNKVHSAALHKSITSFHEQLRIEFQDTHKNIAYLDRLCNKISLEVNHE